MSLSFYYEFVAPAETSTGNLERFLREVEQMASSLGFAPTKVLNVPFDNEERREFSRRLGGGFTVKDDRLKGVAVPEPDQARNHDPVSGECRLIPTHGVVLVVTDECACESCFGFFKFPERVLDIHGRTLAESGLNGAWAFRDFVDSPDLRYRAIVERFQKSGYLRSAKDEFV